MTWSGPTRHRTSGKISASLATARSTRCCSGQHDRGRRQPDRQLHPHQPAAGHQLRLRIGGVQGVRRHRVQRRLRVLRERGQLRAHAGHLQPDHGQHHQSGQQRALLRPERTADLRHRVRRLHRGPHMSRRGQSRRHQHVAPRHCRHQRRHPRLRRVPPGERCLVEPDRAIAADHAEPAARHPSAGDDRRQLGRSVDAVDRARRALRSASR